MLSVCSLARKLARLQIRRSRAVQVFVFAAITGVLGASEINAAQLSLSWIDTSAGQAFSSIERKTGTIIWKLGAPPLCGQHAPTPLPNGNLLIFDNGPHRLDHSMPFSRVIEVEPSRKKIVWEYREKRESDFFSPRISNAQRLPNGNTMICEGDFGRLFEVTAGGELGWEYVNPYFGGPPNALNNRVFRAYRYSAEEIVRARATGSAV